jgi:hypothetical protein
MVRCRQNGFAAELLYSGLDARVIYGYKKFVQRL